MNVVSFALVPFIFCRFRSVASQWEEIEIHNAGFESTPHAIPKGTYDYDRNRIEGWSTHIESSLESQLNGWEIGLENYTGTTAYPGFNPVTPEGTLCVWVNSTFGPIGIEQNIFSHAIQLNTEYKLSLWVGNPAGAKWESLVSGNVYDTTNDPERPFTGYAAQLFVQDQLIAQDYNSTSVAYGTWELINVSVTIADAFSNTDVVGNAFTVRLISLNLVDFDHVRLHMRSVQTESAGPTAQPSQVISTLRVLSTDQDEETSNVDAPSNVNAPSDVFMIVLSIVGAFCCNCCVCSLLYWCMKLLEKRKGLMKEEPGANDFHEHAVQVSLVVPNLLPEDVDDEHIGEQYMGDEDEGDNARDLARRYASEGNLQLVIEDVNDGVDRSAILCCEPTVGTQHQTMTSTTPLMAHTENNGTSTFNALDDV